MDLHVFFLPFLAPGHMIPMVDLARLFADRGAKATVVTTTGNAARIRPTIDRANSALSGRPIQLLTIPFPSSEVGVPDNVAALPTPYLTAAFADAINLLERPFRDLLEVHHADFIVSDIFYPWTADLGTPRIVFHGTGFFASLVPATISRLKLHEAAAGDEEPFVVPGLPHRIELTRSQLPTFVTARDELVARISEAHTRSYGMIMNSFDEMEPEYAHMFKKASPIKVWHVGPVSLCLRDTLDRAVRGDEASVEPDLLLRWLDDQNPGSVLYACFGSLGKFTPPQLGEIASGLEDSGHPFLWVVSKAGGALPEGFEERVAAGGKSLIIRGWVPQLLILNHPAVGGFLTHCGWNSTLEGASAGVPMITWPLFAEQFFNEKLIVDVLGIGVGVGAKVCSAREEARTAVAGEDVRRAVIRLMGGGEEADGRRRRVRELAEKAFRAVEEGGSSHNEMSRLVEELIVAKQARVESGLAMSQI